MIAYLNGKIAQKDAAFIVMDVGGVGYEVKISLQTYAALPNPGEAAKVFTYQQIREDAHVLYGFAEPDEKTLFMDLISVSGVGAATALVMLSSLSAPEIKQAIASENLKVIQTIKGIGAKTAQRILIDLKDKMKKEGVPLVASASTVAGANSKTRSEALAALIMLGIPKPAAEKSVDTIIKREGEDISVEQLIKLALR
ncbi:MAG: Holliday junction branch migration protein RuvA [Runella slithyformis]|nr:MAG: Holliday junction branch migration protein RuvA [Runella slithyformis]TAF95189.1 MAG: Holliday junction branch migration protein RuvA [Runella sp.]TAG18510.1 MAG: Holliday junction branch migration protein RuvA [Cytophagales bacterium]TAG40029.1 MAG: Holliday junction branch migration protein RuvA [Cytophagia bacterium]TAE97033.1 MAG: Holliday junction branch migration protein RuvA [Runella slithyformis]